jgi:hypothetical protein
MLGGKQRTPREQAVLLDGASFRRERFLGNRPVFRKDFANDAKPTGLWIIDSPLASVIAKNIAVTQS